MKRKYTVSDRQYLKDKYKTMTVHQKADALGGSPTYIINTCNVIRHDIMDGWSRAMS